MIDCNASATLFIVIQSSVLIVRLNNSVIVSRPVRRDKA